MTVYNGMVRCEGGQNPPVAPCPCCSKGQCMRCGRFFKRYPNGKLVMHKRRVYRVPKLDRRIR